MGYGRCFSHSAENSYCYWLLSTAFELRSFQHIHHAISIRRFPFHSMLWVEILLAWHHLEYFFEENATSFCLSIQMICLLKVDQRLVNFCTEDLSWSPEMSFALGHSTNVGDLCPLNSWPDWFHTKFRWFSRSQIAVRQCSNGSAVLRRWNPTRTRRWIFPRKFDLTVPIWSWWLDILPC